jgi:hypothetical protein
MPLLPKENIFTKAPRTCTNISEIKRLLGVNIWSLKDDKEN